MIGYRMNLKEGIMELTERYFNKVSFFISDKILYVQERQKTATEENYRNRLGNKERIRCFYESICT
ncbi:MAG: hypothetical protein PVI26_10705 [Chitinispirillia bacterium]|jgi:hypothetical protein